MGFIQELLLDCVAFFLERNTELRRKFKPNQITVHPRSFQEVPPAISVENPLGNLSENPSGIIFKVSARVPCEIFSIISSGILSGILFGISPETAQGYHLGIPSANLCFVLP